MRIEEVKAALGKPVRFRSEKLHCDGVYVMTGCIIRRGNDGFYYQAEIARDNHVVAVRLEDIEMERMGEKPNAQEDREVMKI